MLPMTTPLPRSFNALAGANLAAQSAEQVSLAAAPIVAVLMLGAGPGQIGLLNTAQSLPFLLLSIPLGLLSEDVAPATRELWGNFPQTYSMVGVINGAVRLSRPWDDVV